MKIHLNENNKQQKTQLKTILSGDNYDIKNGLN